MVGNLPRFWRRIAIVAIAPVVIVLLLAAFCLDVVENVIRGIANSVLTATRALRYAAKDVRKSWNGTP